MFGRSWRIGRVGGIPVNVDSSWVWIAVLLTFSLTSQFSDTYGGFDTTRALAYAVATAALFFGSVFLHELAHAVAARLNGIEVFGITLVIFGGFTSARADQKGPGPSFVISAVGPGTSLALTGVFWALSRAVETGPLAGVFGYVGWVNGFMAVFNTLPGLPLDGGRMLEAVVWRLTRNRDRATRIAAWAGIVLGAGVIGFGVLMAARGQLNRGLWPIIIGFFILQGARAAEHQIGLRRRLVGARVADAMGPPPPAIAADLSLSQALDRFATATSGGGFPVLDGDGRVIGIVTFDSARPIGMRDPMRPVRDAVVPVSDVLTVDEGEPLEAVATRVGTAGAALVLRDGRLVGELTSAHLMRWIETSRT